MPRAKKSAPAKSTKINKSAWIRDQPKSLSAKEVVEKAAAKGIKVSVAMVYTVRSSAKKTNSKSPKATVGRPKGSKSRTSLTKSVGRSGDDEMAFRRLVLSIGLPKAESYLSDLKRSVGL